MEPEKATRIVKEWARHLGADLVGICRVDPRWAYSHRGEIHYGEWDEWGSPVPEPLPYAVVVAGKNPSARFQKKLSGYDNIRLVANPGDTVLGLREGCMFRVEGQQMKLIGNRTVRVFRFNQAPLELDPDQDFSEFIE